MIDPSIRMRRAILLNDVLLVQRILTTHPDLLTNPDFSNLSNTNLHLAAQHGHLPVVTFLITASHDAHEISRNTHSHTPLMLAASNGHPAVAQLLATHFPRCIPFTDRHGRDALSLACSNPASAPLLPPLLQHPHFPASPHARDADGNTPLHHASASGSLKSVRILLLAGANPHARNAHDWSPVSYSQTVAAEVFFKNLVAEVERQRADAARQREERERARVGGVRLVSSLAGEEGEEGNALTRTVLKQTVDLASVLDEEDALLSEVLKRHWSPTERRRPMTPGGGGGVGGQGGGGAAAAGHDWGGSALGHVRTRSGSGH